jgi:hypothetical protein
MPQSDRVAELPLQEVERPECPLCKTGMWLMHIVPEEPGCDRRTFNVRSASIRKALSPKLNKSETGPFGYGTRHLTTKVQQLPFLRWPGGQNPFRSHLVVGARATDPYPE